MEDAKTKEGIEETQSKEQIEDEKKKPFASPEIELDVLQPDDYHFQMGGRELILRPITLKKLKGIIADVIKLINAFSGREELLSALEDPGALVNPEIINVLTPVLDSFSAILANLLGVESDWLDENLTLPFMGPIFLNFVKQNNVGLLVEHFRAAALQIRETL